MAHLKKRSEYQWLWLVSSSTRLEWTKKGNMWLFVCSEAVEYKLV